jgi:hypothetical protein
MRFATGKNQSRSVTSVQVQDENGRVTEKTNQEEVESAIFQAIHEDRYHQAEESPICQDQLREDFGYLANTPSAKEVLEGTYNCPEGTPASVKDLFDAMARVYKSVPESTSVVIRPEQWKAYWRVANEDTSSSISGLHFGHYKVGARSDIISHYHAARVTVILAWGIALSRWSNGLTVMLEKVLGCTLVTKLRAILLMEADFNATNKIILGRRMMKTARQQELMPEEIFSEKNREADDGTLAKILFYDVTRQARIPAALASVDATQCYDRIAHAIASLVFQAFGIPQSAAESMLGTIENMKFFLRTGFGDSTSFSGGKKIHIKTQGICQGNGGGPATWGVISIVIVDAHTKKGHGAKFVCPISNLSHHLGGVIFVDDTDLLHINMEEDETVEEAHEALQASVDSWGNLLIVTGGAFKPVKCFYSLISFEWKGGKWSYADNHLKGDFGITVPLPNNSLAAIKHNPVSHSEKTLEAMTSVDGSSKASIKYMQAKAKEWVNDLLVSSFTRRMAWFSMNVQFWPKVSYSLCNTMATFDVLAASLQSEYYRMLPKCGVVRSTPTWSRMLDGGFYGIGMPHPGVEALVEMSNKVLTHYGCKSAVGLLLQSSHDLLFLEVGLSFQPLQLDYKRYQGMVTLSWLKMWWEKVSMFDLKVNVSTPLNFPRKGDRFLMQVFEDMGFCWSELCVLNRVRVHQQVLFFSDVLNAAGHKIEPEKLHPRPTGVQWSSFSRWPTERPTPKDFKAWQEALDQICPSKSMATPVGEFVHPSHRIWRWKWCPVSNQLKHISNDITKMDVYEPSYGSRFALLNQKVPIDDSGCVCSVTKVTSGVKISSRAYGAPSPSVPTTFMEVLKEWGCTWMWEGIDIRGGMEWIKDAIAEGTLLAVTDGSYIRELHPHLCSAAFILECSKGRGIIIGKFSNRSVTANAYRGELLGLLAIHLLLLSVNKLHPNLPGEVDIVSDCLGALNRVSHLPPYKIPSRCKHSDILKTILVNCRDMTFKLCYSHVKAHQDDSESFASLSRRAQLNCMCDYKAKEVITDTVMKGKSKSAPFPLEPICMYVEDEKMTSDTGQQIRFAAHHQLARQSLTTPTKNGGEAILSTEQFDEVDWMAVHAALHSVPKLFQVWASKQVLKIAGTKKFLAYQEPDQSKKDPWCPSCKDHIEDCAHIVLCQEVGRTEAFMELAGTFSEWLEESDTCEELEECLRRYIKGRGVRSCYACAVSVEDPSTRLLDFAKSQDVIGWDNFMLGMISHKLFTLQRDYRELSGSRNSTKKWVNELIIQLLQVTHGQWIYRNVVVHDRTSGQLISEHKEQLRIEIEKQSELGAEGLIPEDQYLLEINHEDFESSSGEKQEYWLLAIRAARKACLLRRQADGEEVEHS